MDTLIQIIYVSRSTFTSSKPLHGIEPNVGRILAKSRANNRRNALVGVLYFGDDCFFQCLEGKEEAVDALYEKLHADPRHKDLKLISRKNIAALSFSDWAMKYVPLEKQMTELLHRHGHPTFDPYRFSPEMIGEVIALLHAGADAPDRDLPAPVASAAPATPSAARPAAKTSPTWSKPVLILLFVALLASAMAVMLAR